PLTATTSTLTTQTATTVLVADTCTRNPRGPGC
ncbi:MAG: hypothetical protein RI885_2582, partial [Actinomycetota bacterium]